MKNYSRRELYAAGEFLGESSTKRKLGGGYICGGGGGPTSSVTQTSNIPEYAQPYVENMLGAAQQQIFSGQDAEGNYTGFQPYRAYGGTYSTDPTTGAVTQTGYNPAAYFATYDPLSSRAYTEASTLGTPGQYYTGTGLAAAEIGRAHV